MKKMHLPIRLLSLLLAVALLCGLAAPARAVGTGGTRPSFTQVDHRQVSASLQEPFVESQTNETDHADTDLVRVSIFLKKASTLEAGYSTQAIATDTAAVAYRDALVDLQGKVTSSIERLTGRELDVVWNLTLAANAISANVEYGQIAGIEQLPEVEQVVLETRYEPQESAASEISMPMTAISTQMTGTNLAWQAGYTGAGRRIAVIDTGLDTDHQSVNADALAHALQEEAGKAEQSYEDYLQTIGVLDEAEIASVMDKLNATKRYEGLTAADLYQNLKVPFGFNYIDWDLDITHDNDSQGEHGSHVAGISLANRYLKQEDQFVSALDTVRMVGNAPDAQVLVMKVFGKYGGAYDSDYMAAIEDAIVLGCDSVNLSLGSAAPGEPRNDTYAGLLNSLTETDTVVAISMGNNSYWAESGQTFGYPYLDNPNFYTGGSPGSYANALTVASVDNDGMVSRPFTVEGRSFSYGEPTGFGNQPLYTLDPTEDGSGTTYDFVLLPTIGEAGDYAGVDVSGKVVFVSRGSTSFADKANLAVSQGAIATVIYNNQAGTINMDLTGYTGQAPCISITQEEGTWIREHAQAAATQDGRAYYTGSVTIWSSLSAECSHSPYLTMSSFSSWGVPGNLTLKPEITAPGGNIYSLNGALQETDQYELMSGTSMAAPQIAGISALVLQAVEARGLEQDGLTNRALAQSLMMSTAVPMRDADGRYYPVIQQGAGLVDAAAAIGADSYVLVNGQPDGKVKAELGEDRERSGEYRFQFDIHNLEDRERVFALSADVFTQDAFQYYANAQENPEEMALYMDTQTAELEADVTWTAGGAPVNSAGEMAVCDFNGDGQVDSADGQALLDYVTGTRDSIQNEEHGDLDGNGVVDTYDVHLFASKLGKDTVTVPAGGSVTIAVTIRLTQAQKEFLDAYYTGGAYVEAYVRAEAVATEEGVAGTSHSIPVLAFYGSWTDGSMFEVGSYPEYATGQEKRTPYLGDQQVNAFAVSYGDRPEREFHLGGNPLIPDAVYLPERNAINSQRGDTVKKVSFTAVRNGADSRFTVCDAATGEILAESATGPVTGAFYYPNLGYWQEFGRTVNLNWTPKDLSEGTQLELALTLAPDLYVDGEGNVDWETLGQGASLKIPLTVDNTAPSMEGLQLDMLNNALTVEAWDNQYVAAVVLYNITGTAVLAQAGAAADADAGETRSFSLDLNGVNGSKFLLQVADYAMNVTTYEINLQVGQGQGLPSFLAFDMSVGRWVSFDKDATRWDLVDHANSDFHFHAATIADHLVFASTDRGLLYVMPETDLGDVTYVARTGKDFTDLAYNKADGLLYGVFEKTLMSIDKLTGEVTEIGEIGVDTNTLACDGAGTFYCSKYGTGEVYTFTLDTLSEPALVVATNLSGSHNLQAMEVDPNSGLLYWSSYYYYTAYFLEIDPKAGAYVRYNDLNHELCCLLIPENASGGGWAQPTDQVRSVQISSTNRSIVLENTAQLSATVLPWTATDRSVIWSSSDPSVATVDQQGLVTGLTEGECVITATAKLDPTVSASCKVTVETVKATLEGVLRNPDGDTVLFHWNLEEESTWSQTRKLDTTLSTATYDKAGDKLYVLDAAGVAKDMRMHQVDRATGEILGTVAPCAWSDPLVSVAALEQSTPEAPHVAAMSSDSFYYPLNPMEEGFDGFGGGFSFLSRLSESTGGTKLVAMAANGTTLNQYGTVCDVIYILDDAGYMWILEAPKRGSYGFSFVPTDLSVDFPMYEKLQYCSMVAGDDGNLYLSRFTGDGTEIYRLSWDAEQGMFVSALVTNMGSGVWPAALYAVKQNGTAAESAIYVPETPMFTVEAEPGSVVEISDTAIERVAPGGTLHVAHTGAAPRQDLDRLPVSLQSVGHQTECTGKTVTLTMTADDATTNGLIALDYDPDCLSLEGADSQAAYSSFHKETGRVTFGYANSEAVPAGTVLATLTFRAEEETEATFAITKLQNNDLHLNETEEVTLTVPEHAYEETVVPATCTEGGYTQHTCQTCGKSYRDHFTEALGHAWSDWTESKAPTCTRTGEEMRTCASCGETETRLTAADSSHCPSEAFHDLDCTRWYHEGVDFVLRTGIMKGVGVDRFLPNGTLTRGQMVTVLYRMADEPETAETTPFTDVNMDRYYGNAIAWAAENGIAKGVTDTRFAPDAAVTREQMVTFLARYAKYSGQDVEKTADLTEFDDWGRISNYAKEPMAWAVECGILTGMDGLLNPRGNATRAQIATVLLRYSEII